MPSLMIILETLAARRVVHFIQEIGHHRSILEGDSESSINALCHKNLLFHSSCLRHFVFY